MSEYLWLVERDKDFLPAQDPADVMKRVEHHHMYVEDAFPDHCVLFTALVGSQNYNLNTSDSDVDTKSVVMPKNCVDLFFKEPVSVDEHYEGELCAVKDLRLYMNCLFKQNPNFVETLFSKYVVVNANYASLYKRLVDTRRGLANFDANKMYASMAGMAVQYQKNWEKTHNPKYAANAARMVRAMGKYVDLKSFDECLMATDMHRNLRANQEKAETYMSDFMVPGSEISPFPHVDNEIFKNHLCREVSEYLMRNVVGG